MEHHDVPRPVSPRPDAPDIAFDYTLTIDHCAEQYALAGHARTVRTIQRYCKNGALDARKVTTLTGDRFLITPHSLRRHIEELNQLAAQTATIGQGWTPYDSGDAPLRHRPPLTVPVVASEPARASENLTRHRPTAEEQEPQGPVASAGDERREPTQAQPEQPRHDAPSRAPSDIGAQLPASEIQFLRDQITIKDGQLAVKDRQLEAKDAQIVALLDRNKESNILIQTMQQLLKPLLPHLKSSEQGSSPSTSNTGETVLH
jgi:hypothetical protein